VGRPPSGVFCPFRELVNRIAISKEERVAVRGRREPLRLGKARESGVQIWQKQPRSVQAVALPHTQDAVTDAFEAKLS
jgi:hypothetical protein